MAFWLSACGFFFTGLGLALRLEPLPPRPVFEARGDGDDMRNFSGPAMRGLGSSADRNLADSLYETPAEPELGVPQLPGLAAGMSRAEVLEQLAKLREQGDLSGTEYERARHELLGG